MVNPIPPRTAPVHLLILWDSGHFNTRIIGVSPQPSYSYSLGIPISMSLYSFTYARLAYTFISIAVFNQVTSYILNGFGSWKKIMHVESNIIVSFFDALDECLQIMLWTGLCFQFNGTSRTHAKPHAKPKQVKRLGRSSTMYQYGYLKRYARLFSVPCTPKTWGIFIVLWMDAP